jgi:hypothetical protein
LEGAKDVPHLLGVKIDRCVERMKNAGNLAEAVRRELGR